MRVLEKFRDVFSWSRAGSLIFLTLFIFITLAYSGANSDLERTHEKLVQAEEKLDEARTGSLKVVHTELISPSPIVTRMESEVDGDVKNYRVKLVNAGDSGTVRLGYSFLSANRTVLATQNQTVGMSGEEEKVVNLRYSSPDESETWEVSTSDAESEEFRVKIFNTDYSKNQVNVTLTLRNSNRETLEIYTKTKTVPTDEYETVSFYVETPESFESYNIHAGYEE